MSAESLHVPHRLANHGASVRWREQPRPPGLLARISLRSAKVRRLRAELVWVEHAAAADVEELAKDGQDSDQ